MSGTESNKKNIEKKNLRYRVILGYKYYANYCDKNKNRIFSPSPPIILHKKKEFSPFLFIFFTESFRFF